MEKAAREGWGQEQRLRRECSSCSGDIGIKLPRGVKAGSSCLGDKWKRLPEGMGQEQRVKEGMFKLLRGCGKGYPGGSGQE